MRNTAPASTSQTSRTWKQVLGTMIAAAAAGLSAAGA